MSYSVDWAPEARATLTTIWIAAADRSAVTAAQVRIDHLLAANPTSNGVPVSEGLYAIEVHPLRALFEIDDIGRFVRVVSVGELP